MAGVGLRQKKAHAHRMIGSVLKLCRPIGMQKYKGPWGACRNMLPHKPPTPSHMF